MITRERLATSVYGARYLELINQKLRKFKVIDWGNDDSQTKGENRPGDRVQSDSLVNANVVSSRHIEDDPLEYMTGEGEHAGARHALVLDIDHPTWLMPSTAPDHYHLYVDVPGGITNEKYNALLTALADAGVIEWGYASASIARGWTSVRLPWIAKEKGPKQHD